MKHLFVILFFLMTFLCFAGNQKAYWNTTHNPIECVDSIYEANNIEGQDTSLWTKIYYVTNQGYAVQYNDLYETEDGTKYVFSIINVLDDSMYTVQFFKIEE